MRQLGDLRTDPLEAGDSRRRGSCDRGFIQPFARQIEPAAFGVLPQIAQDVGELEGATERMCDLIGAGDASPMPAPRGASGGAATRSQ